MDTLLDSAHGEYEVTTTASTYQIDLDQMVFRRIPRATDPDSAELRRDHETVNLISVVDCTVGRSMALIIDLHVPGVAFTSRVTTPVIAIELMASPGIEPISESSDEPSS